MSNQNSSIQFIRFVKNFESNLNLLKRRYERFKEINNPLNSDIDVSTYFDMIIVQLRAMCIENDRNGNNYTIQILLQKIGKSEEAEKINKMFNRYFFSVDLDSDEIVENDSSDLSIKKALKFLADKVICHYDNFDDHPSTWGAIEAIISHLRNPFCCTNLDYIIKTIFDSVDHNVTPDILMQLLKEIQVEQNP